jgi:hypothetical protein
LRSGGAGEARVRVKVARRRVRKSMVEMIGGNVVGWVG